MTPDDATPDTGTLTRRALRARTGEVETARQPALPFSDAAEPSDTDAETVDDTAESTPDAAESREELPPEALVHGIDEDKADGVDEDRDDDPETLTDAETEAQEDVDSDATEALIAETQWADEERPATALTWLETEDVEESTLPADLEAITMDEDATGLLADAPLRPALLRTRWLVPLGTVAVLAIAYAASMLMWPLHEVPPTVAAVEFETTPTEAAVLTWPGAGSAGVSVAGISSAASSPDAASIASLTKVVTSLMVLDRMPLQLGQPGPAFHFTNRDSANYWDYLRSNQSALDVPVGGSLTEYQMLQGILLGSANNYVDRMANDLWGSDEQFAIAAKKWLADRGLTGITIVTPSGFDERNVATPEALLQLSERAMQNPVFAEIVGTASVDIPGAGRVNNTNGMLTDAGVLGIKTGTLVGWSLLTAKDVTVNDTTVHLYTSVLNQAGNDERLAATRTLFAEVEAALAATAPAVASGTVVGEVSTPWGYSVDVVTDDDATVLLWNGASASADVTFDLRDERADGDEIGTLSVAGPLDATQIEVSLDEEVDGPSPWWRLTHPFELLGVTTAD